MKERPILFSAPMVRAILAGTKTQTRRVVKRQAFRTVSELTRAILGPISPCPYGIPGDRLWVREAWRVGKAGDHARPSDLVHHSKVWYEADVDNLPAGRLRPSIFMPRWASRISLEIEAVRVQRLQEIAEEDAKAEGVELHTWNPHPEAEPSFTAGFAEGWDRINKKRGYSWASNPFVWCLSFSKIDT